MASESVKNEMDKLQEALQNIGFDVEEIRIKPKADLSTDFELENIHYTAGMICRKNADGTWDCR